MTAKVIFALLIISLSVYLNKKFNILYKSL
jgi:hypothetical protein